MILYACPTCDSHLEVEDHCTGQKHPCPHCGQRLQVPPPSRNKDRAWQTAPRAGGS